MSEASLFERDLYVEITLAWYQRQPRGLKPNFPFRPYLLGRGFAESVKASPKGVDREHVAAVCALLVSLEPWQLGRLQKVMDTQGIGLVPKGALDPVSAWWYPLNKPSVLGIHYWELGNGTIELQSLARFDKPPALRFSRFAKELAASATMVEMRQSA